MMQLQTHLKILFNFERPYKENHDELFEFNIVFLICNIALGIQQSRLIYSRRFFTRSYVAVLGKMCRCWLNQYAYASPYFFCVV